MLQRLYFVAKHFSGKIVYRHSDGAWKTVSGQTNAMRSTSIALRKIAGDLGGGVVTQGRFEGCCSLSTLISLII